MTYPIWLQEPFAKKGTSFSHCLPLWGPEACAPLQEWLLTQCFGS